MQFSKNKNKDSTEDMHPSVVYILWDREKTNFEFYVSRIILEAKRKQGENSYTFLFSAEN